MEKLWIMWCKWYWDDVGIVKMSWYYTWIEIVHDSEGSQITDHGCCILSYITWFYRHWIIIATVFVFMETRLIVSWNISHFWI